MKALNPEDNTIRSHQWLVIGPLAELREIAGMVKPAVCVGAPSLGWYFDFGAPVPEPEDLSPGERSLWRKRHWGTISGSFAASPPEVDAAGRLMLAFKTSEGDVDPIRDALVRDFPACRVVYRRWPYQPDGEYVEEEADRSGVVCGSRHIMSSDVRS